MARLSNDLKNLGYEPTEKDSPFHDDGRLWTNSYEFVCNKTGFVIRKDEKRWYQGDDGTLKLKEKFKYNDDEDESS